jgi:GNAT superfamily N-acetyltransferase
MTATPTPRRVSTSKVDPSTALRLVSSGARMLGWVPVRSLQPRHRKRIQAHLEALSPADRYLRFGHAAGDEQIRRYVDGIDFARDEVFGIFNRRLRLIAVAHLAYDRPPQLSGVPAMAEFGVSVEPDARGRGYGGHLFQHAVMHARNRAIPTLFVHALSENAAMLKIARHAGATVERDGSDSLAWLKLPPQTLGSRLGQGLDTQAAEANFWLKRLAVRLKTWLDVVQDIRTQVAATGKAAQV